VEGTVRDQEETKDMAKDTRTVDGLQPPAPGKYELDQAHTAVEFVARHILTKVRGRFTDFTGWIDVAEPIENSSVHVEVKTGSIQTNTEQRDEHLKSDDFLNVEQYPVMTFESTAIRHVGGAGFELEGDLTIRDTTRRITLAGEFLGTGTDPYGKTILSASARATLAREDWNVNWNMVLETGGLLVSKTVDLELEVEAVKTG
jgi:polyisoprenoid-binding protein YceI